MTVYVLLGVGVFLPFIPVLKILPLGADETGIASTINLVFVLFLNISFLLAAWIALKWVDRRPAALLGMNFWPESLLDLTKGMAIGVVNFGAVFLMFCAFGWISLDWNQITTAQADSFILSVATYFVFACFEELVNRGYLFQVLCEGIGVWIAAVVFSLVFSVVHVMNPEFSILAGLFLFVHGLLYAVAYLKTRSLWTPIGLHMAWNLAQGPLAGMRVSGTGVDHSILSTEVHGPEVFTGGDFGVEGGLVAITASVIILLILTTGHWLKPSQRFLRIQREWARGRDHRSNSGGLFGWGSGTMTE